MNIQRNIISSILSMIFLLVACTQQRENKSLEEKYSITGIGTASFTSSIDSLLQLFTEKANCKDCFYEMYIDRRDFNETLIILRAGSYYRLYEEKIDLYQDYIKAKKPLLYTENNGFIFFIYTGMETLLDSVSTTKIVDFKNKKSSVYEYSWVIKIIDKKIDVYEDCWMNPFGKLEFLGVIDKFVIPPDSIDLLKEE